jgi:hypothetical protein
MNRGVRSRVIDSTPNQLETQLSNEPAALPPLPDLPLDPATPCSQPVQAAPGRGSGGHDGR